MNRKYIYSELKDIPSKNRYNTRLIGYDDKNRYKILLAIDKDLNNTPSLMLQLNEGDVKFDHDISKINLIKSVTIDKLSLDVSEESGLNVYYIIRLGKSANDEIFYKLIDDIIITVEKSKEPYIIKDVIKRVKSWINFFEVNGGQVLSENSQLGLFAELSILKILLKESHVDKSSIINSWVGPKKENQDFIFPNKKAIEVKCKSTNSPNEILINNEYQLDDSGLDELYLAIYHVKRHKMIANTEFETLPSVVSDILDLIDDKSTSLHVFKGLLLDVGYQFKDTSEYGNYSFQIIDGPTIYNVDHSFPKLSRSNLPIEINKVKYVINIQNQESIDGNISKIIKI